MQKAWKCQRQGTGATAGLRLGFKHFNAHARLRQHNRSGKPVGASSDHYRSSLGRGHKESVYANVLTRQWSDTPSSVFTR